MTSIKSFFYSVLILLSSQAISGENPVAWQLNHSFGGAVSVGIPTSIIYTFTNQFSFPLTKPLLIIKDGSPQVEFSYVDNCSGVRLQSKQSCTVQVTLQPINKGVKYLQLTIARYDSNQVMLPRLATQAIE